MNYRLLWLSSFVSQTGNWLYMIALPLEVYRLTGSAFHMANIFGVEFLPWVLFSLFGGLLADRVNRKTLLVVGNWLSLLFVGILTFVLYAESIQMVWIYLSVFCLASINPLIHPAFQSMIPHLVPKERLVKANSGIQFVDTFLSFLGPMIGGAVLALIGGKTALFIDACTFVMAALLLMCIRYDAPSALKREQTGQTFLQKMGQDLLEGLKYVGTNKVVLYGSFLFLFTNFAINIFQSNYIYFLTNTLQLEPELIGLTIGLSGVGPILGSFIAPYFGKRVQPGRLILMSTAMAGAVMMLMFVARSFWQVALIQAVVLAFGSMNVITYFSLRQKIVPSYILGRVVSVTRMISYTTIPIGAFVGGLVVAKGISIYWLILLGGVIRLAVGVIGFFTPLNDGKAQQAAPLEQVEAEA